MAEIMDDLKVELLEISQSNGINLTSESTRIKHTKNGQFDITSNGIINISTGDGILNNNDLQINGNINIVTKNADNTMDEELSINIVGGDGTSQVDGSYISIKAGNGLQGANSSGGEVTIYGGSGEGTGTGGQVRIGAGSNLNGYGGDLYLEAGLSQYKSAGITGNSGGSIIIQSGYGGETCGNIDFFSSPTNSAQSIGPGGNINFYLGPTNLGFNETLYGTSGKVNIINGALKLAVFADTSQRTSRIPNPEKGDMCFVNNKINVHDGSNWRTISFD
jgi:flagellar basal body rod protein FlgG